MIITRQWAMPNKNTFSIRPIGQLIDKYLTGFSVDPFANTNRLATVTNDLDESYGTDFCMDAMDFLKTLDDNSVDTVLFDPPYSPRQVSEVYKELGMSVNMQTTQSSFWGNLKKEITRITKADGLVITCGWNSGGIGMVAHGGWHNDTIVTVERKQADLFS